MGSALTGLENSSVISRGPKRDASPELMAAITEGSLPIVAQCLRGMRGQVSKENLETAFVAAREVGQFDVMGRFLLSERVEELSQEAIGTALVSAAEKGHVAFVKTVFDRALHKIDALTLWEAQDGIEEESPIATLLKDQESKVEFYEAVARGDDEAVKKAFADKFDLPTWKRVLSIARKSGQDAVIEVLKREINVRFKLAVHDENAKEAKAILKAAGDLIPIENVRAAHILVQQLFLEAVSKGDRKQIERFLQDYFPHAMIDQALLRKAIENAKDRTRISAAVNKGFCHAAGTCQVEKMKAFLAAAGNLIHRRNWKAALIAAADRVQDGEGGYSREKQSAVLSALIEHLEGNFLRAALGGNRDEVIALCREFPCQIGISTWKKALGAAREKEDRSFLLEQLRGDFVRAAAGGDHARMSLILDELPGYIRKATCRTALEHAAQKDVKRILRERSEEIGFYHTARRGDIRAMKKYKISDPARWRIAALITKREEGNKAASYVEQTLQALLKDKQLPQREDSGRLFIQGPTTLEDVQEEALIAPHRSPSLRELLLDTMLISNG